MILLFFWLLVGHALCDYPLQGDFLAKAKNRKTPLPGVPWIHGLFWHALIHAGAVLLVTGRPLFAALELGLHMVIDDAKCHSGLEPGRAFHLDQYAHVLCKALYIALEVVRL